MQTGEIVDRLSQLDISPLNAKENKECCTLLRLLLLVDEG